MTLLPKEMMVALTIIFALICLMIVRQIRLLRKENKAKKGVSYFKYPLTMSISERLRRKHRHFKW